MPSDEGVIQFNLDFTPGPPLGAHRLSDLRAWRRICLLLDILGQNPERYGGYGFGNISRRMGDEEGPGFIISGSQTGHLADLEGGHWSVVSGWDLAVNRITARGPVRPSSESLAHAALYDQDQDIGAVIHAHSPHIWQWGRRNGLPATPPDAAHGTVAMASAVAACRLESGLSTQGIFIMAGHEDGIIAFGRDLAGAGLLLVRTLSGALAETLP
jgi:ribulose-5-phosphate 4-epimerase/fuculose-1-phosphate aldolase